MPAPHSGLSRTAAIAMDVEEKSDTRLRALKQIADETAADVEGMLEALQGQIDLLERQIAGEVVVALHRPEGKSPPTRSSDLSVESIVESENIPTS